MICETFTLQTIEYIFVVVELFANKIESRTIFWSYIEKLLKKMADKSRTDLLFFVSRWQTLEFPEKLKSHKEISSFNNINKYRNWFCAFRILLCVFPIFLHKITIYPYLHYIMMACSSPLFSSNYNYIQLFQCFSYT